MIAEWLWILAGLRDVASIARYNSKIADYSDDGMVFAGAYGPRLSKQWNWIVDTLTNDPDSRQAVAGIWTPQPEKSKDIPCTTQAQFLIRGGKLHSIWTMRSNDLWLGLTYDFFNQSMITNALAAVLKLPVGSLTLNTGSSHVYERDLDLITGVLENSLLGECLESPQLAKWPAAVSILYQDQYVLKYGNEQEIAYYLALASGKSELALNVLRELAPRAEKKIQFEAPGPRQSFDVRESK